MQLIYAFVFAYAKSKFSLDAAHMAVDLDETYLMSFKYNGIGHKLYNIRKPSPSEQCNCRGTMVKRDLCVRNKI